MPGLNSETQRKVKAILALPEPPKKQKPVPYHVGIMNNAISILERMDKKIGVALIVTK